jgi:uncharacterized membrane-anchored protein
MQGAKDIWLLLNICTCCIVTSGIVSKLTTFQLLKDDEYEEDFDRSVKAFGVFGMFEMISAIAYATIAEGIAPLIILLLAWFVSCFAVYFNYKIAYEGSTVDNETHMKRANVLRLVLWLIRFIVLFVLVV